MEILRDTVTLQANKVLIISSGAATNDREGENEQPHNLTLSTLEKLMGRRRRMPPHGGPGCYEVECMMKVGDDDYQVGRPGSCAAAQYSLRQSKLSYTTSCCHHFIPSPSLSTEYHCTHSNDCIPNTIHNSNRSNSSRCFENSIITTTTTIHTERPNRQMSF